MAHQIGPGEFTVIYGLVLLTYLLGLGVGGWVCANSYSLSYFVQRVLSL